MDITHYVFKNLFQGRHTEDEEQGYGSGELTRRRHSGDLLSKEIEN